MNLHHVVRGVINSVAKDKACKIYRSTGKQVRSARGDFDPVFAAPEECRCQFQSVSSDVLQHYEKIEITAYARRIYLYADYDPASRPWAQWRPLGRSGDIIEDDLGCFWLVHDVLDDFTHEGWVSLLATLQPTPQTLRIEEDDSEGSD